MVRPAEHKDAAVKKRTGPELSIKMHIFVECLGNLVIPKACMAVFCFIMHYFVYATEERI